MEMSDYETLPGPTSRYMAEKQDYRGIHRARFIFSSQKTKVFWCRVAPLPLESLQVDLPRLVHSAHMIFQVNIDQQTHYEHDEDLYRMRPYHLSCTIPILPDQFQALVSFLIDHP